MAGSDVYVPLLEQPWICAVLMTAALAALASISAPHLKALHAGRSSSRSGRRNNDEQRRRSAILLSAGPASIAALKAYGVVAPGGLGLTHVLIALCEVVLFAAFFEFLRACLRRVDDGEGDEAVLRAIAGADTTWKVWAVPPFCLCWLPLYPCMPLRSFGASDLAASRRLVVQFAIAAPLIALLDVADVSADAPRLQSVLVYLDAATTMSAVYGLFALLFAAERVLHNGGLHQKFWAFKSILIADKMIFRLCLALTHDDLALAAARAGALTVLTCVPQALLVRSSFPPSEFVTAGAMSTALPADAIADEDDDEVEGKFTATTEGTEMTGLLSHNDGY